MHYTKYMPTQIIKYIIQHFIVISVLLNDLVVSILHSYFHSPSHSPISVLGVDLACALALADDFDLNNVALPVVVYLPELLERQTGMEEV